MSVAVYMRVSTKAQELEGQRQAINRWLEGHGATESDCEWFVDKGMSGTTLDRPAMKALQHKVFTGEVDTIIIYKLDRFARSAVEGMVVLSKWLKLGIRLIVVTMDIDFSGEVGQMIASLLLHIAQMERTQMLERQEAGLAVKRQQIAAIVELNAKGVPIAQISTTTNVSIPQIRTCLDRGGKAWWGGPGGASKPRILDGPRRAAKYAQQGFIQEEIGKLLGVSVPTVRRYVRIYKESQDAKKEIAAVAQAGGDGDHPGDASETDRDIHGGGVSVGQGPTDADASDGAQDCESPPQHG